MGYSVGSRAVGPRPGPSVGRKLMDGLSEGYEDDPLYLAERRELAGAWRRTLGPAGASLSSALLLTNPSKAPEREMPIAAATTLPPAKKQITVVLRRRRASGVDARIIYSCGVVEVVFG